MGHDAAEVVFSLSTGPDRHASHGIFRYTDGSSTAPRPWKRGRPKGSKNRTAGDRIGTVNKPQFEFVNVTQPNMEIGKASRAIIRRHAKLHQNSPNGDLHGPVDRKRPEDPKLKRQTSREMSRINLRQIPGVDPFDKTPIKLEPYMHDLLSYFSTTIWKYFYSLEELAGCNPMADYWLPLAFRDRALIHSFIGCADVFISGYSTIQDGSRGLKHLSTAISIVKQRLTAGNDIMPIGTLSVIAGIALLEKGAGRHDHWWTHMQGLKQLIGIHGGVERFHSEPLVLNKIYRADLYGSLDSAQSPHFDRPAPLTSTTPSEVLFCSEGFNAINQVLPLNKTLGSCVYHLEDAMIFWGDINDSSFGTQASRKDAAVEMTRPTPAEAARVRHLLTDIQYTLVSANFQQRSDDDWESQFSELLRITLILYSLTILNERPVSTSVGQQVADTFQLLLTNLKCRPYRTTQNAGSESSLPLLPIDFYLWAIFLAVSVTKTTQSNTKDWLLSSFLELVLCEYEDINDWHALRSRLSRYLWVSSIHDHDSQWLWSEMVELRRSRAWLIF